MYRLHADKKGCELFRDLNRRQLEIIALRKAAIRWEICRLLSFCLCHRHRRKTHRQVYPMSMVYANYGLISSGTLCVCVCVPLYYLSFLLFSQQRIQGAGGHAPLPSPLKISHMRPHRFNAFFWITPLLFELQVTAKMPYIYDNEICRQIHVLLQISFSNAITPRKATFSGQNTVNNTVTIFALCILFTHKYHMQLKFLGNGVCFSYLDDNINVVPLPLAVFQFSPRDT